MKKILLTFLFCLSIYSFGQSDCITAIPVCGNSNLSYTPSGHGLIAEELGGCMATDERFTVWYTFSVGTSGTLAFTITPNNLSDDYDFAVYGPNIPCSQVGTSTGQPMRCNYSGTPGLTGLSLTVPGPGNNNQWSPFINAIAGESYILVVDNYSMSTNGFTLSWQGTAALTSPFTPSMQPNPFISPGPNQNGEVIICNNPQLFDFSTLSAGILNGNTNFSINYYNNSNDALTGNNPITTPINVNTTTNYIYAISYTDPTNPNNPANTCKEFAIIKFKDGSIPLTPATLTACNNNNAGTAIYDLTTANVYTGTQTMTSVKYYPTMTDVNAGTNQINNPQAYLSSQGTVYVKYVNTFQCERTTSITLQFYPSTPVMDATLEECFLTIDPTKAEFDLTTAHVTTLSSAIKNYYLTMQDAIHDINPIANPFVYQSTTTTVYVRVYSGDGCWNIAKINLKVKPPVYSSVLTDKTICIEDRTTLDAGPGFTSYKWSTGATTQSISNVQVGEYWVELGKNGCITRQTVKVNASNQPVVTALDVNFTTITVTVSGGKAPYQYSLDGITWQTSNVLNNVPRGQAIIYVKDIYDCDPVATEITVPNLVNVITPNDDNVNDYIDYSALQYKKDLTFTIYNRYGNKVYEGNKKNLYRWDGRSGGKKVSTGTYWYTITWNEPATNAPIKYSGWVMVKNRE